MKSLRDNWSIYLFVSLVIALLAIAIYASSSATKDAAYRPAWSSGSCAVVFANDVNDANCVTGVIRGTLTGIVIEPTGTDTDYKVYLYDDHQKAVFSKTDCNTVAGIYRYALTAANTAGTHFLGVPVSGSPFVQIADSNGLTNLEVTVYYEETAQ